MEIDTPMGKDVLLLQKFEGVERVSGLFSFRLEMLSKRNSIDFACVVGRNVTVTLNLPEGKKRRFNGIIRRFSQGTSDSRFTLYQAEMVPWTWLLTNTSDCRIFQKMSIPDIVQKIFKDNGFKDFKNHLQKSYPVEEYCVQYRETAFNFVSRLMEQVGIFYYFEHVQGKHDLIMADTPGEHQPCEHQPVASCEPTLGALAKEDLVGSWTFEQEIRPEKYSLTDYNFEIPSNNLGVNVDSLNPPTGGQRYELYDYPGAYLYRDLGDQLVKLRIEEEEVLRIVASGSSGCRGFASGYRFALKNHYRPDFNKAYVLLAVNHTAEEQSYISGEDEAQFKYSNTFSCIPATVPFRPSRATRRPVVEGAQTAVVVGPPGEEIWVDKYGRVKVQFHWDRDGKKNDESSCWIRVSQHWAGKNWGLISIPRIGQEVVVDFLEGDPDQPLITGQVYNAEQMPPYPLPKHQTRSTMKSRSSKGGGPANYNEIRFEDKKGSEQVFVHAERDLDLRTKNNFRTWVGHNSHLVVGGNRSERIEGQHHLYIGSDQKEQIAGASHTKIEGDSCSAVSGSLSLTVDRDRDEKVGMKYAAEAGMEIHLKAGMKVILEAGVQLSIKAGGSFIDLSPAGIAIQGVLVNINSGGAAGAGSGASPASPSPPQKPDHADDGSKGDKL